MTLTVGTGPFGQRPRGTFNREMPDVRGLIYFEDYPRRIRARFAGETVIGAYKGFASYFSVRVGDTLEQDLVWTYLEPRHEAQRIAGYLCFFNERVDLEIDGERQERPITSWSRQPPAEVP